MAGILRNIRMDGVSMKEFLTAMYNANFPMIKDMYCGGDYYALYLTDEAGFEKRKIGGNDFMPTCGTYNYTAEGSISSFKPHH